jgi:hypothetical protein
MQSQISANEDCKFVSFESFVEGIAEIQTLWRKRLSGRR